LLSRCGIFASAKANGGGAPSAVSEVVETQAVATASAATTNVTLATDLVAGDIVLVTYSYFFTGTSSARTVAGATFNSIFTAKRLNNPRQSAYWATGLTGAGKVITVPSAQGITGGAIVAVIRGLTTPVVAGTESSAYGATSLIASQSLPGALTVSPNKVALIVGMKEAGTSLVNLSGLAPALGWSSIVYSPNNPNGDLFLAWNDDVVASGSLAGTAAFASTTGYIGVSAIVLGS